MDEPKWILNDLVLAIHQTLIAEHGGSEGIRDKGLLASALARPKNVWAYLGSQADIASLAGAYACGITRNHPFVDGNKRTALAVCRTFLQINGWSLNATQIEKYEVFRDLASGSIAEEDFVCWLRERLTEV